MTHSELLAACTWDENDLATLTIQSALFGGPVEVRLLPDLEYGRRVSERMVAVLHDFLALTAALPAVKQLLWADCLANLESIDYGADVQPSETELAANQREFGLYAADDAYAQSNLRRLSIPDEPALRHRYGTIDFEPQWETEHGCSLILQDGRLIATAANNPSFRRYEADDAAPAA